jgi:transposase
VAAGRPVLSGLLVYGYTTGVFSSRRLERATYDSVAFRFIAKGARTVGNQRRLPLKDVLAYKADDRAKRRQTLGELAGLDQELGLE